MDAAQHRLQILPRRHITLENHDTVQGAQDFDGVGKLGGGARFMAFGHHAACLAQRPLGGLGKMLEPDLGARPDRNRSEWSGVRLTEQDHAGPDPGKLTA